MTKSDVLNLISKVKIGKVISFQKNENSDHLLVVQITDGTQEIQIVTGANNFKEGDLVPYLGVGETVPGFLFKDGTRLVLEKRKLRGYDSNGMILAEDEIGLSEDHEGIMILNGSDDLIGKSLLDYLSESQLNMILENAKVVELSAETQQKLSLITKNLAEVIGEDEIGAVLQQQNLKIYWGTAPTGKPSIGYFVPMIKIGDFLKAGCEVTILIADLHAYLDNMKSSWELLEYRSQYYQLLIKEILKSFDVPIEKLKFVKGSDFQLSKEYTLDMYKIAVQTTVQSVKGAGAEVVKQVENPVLGGMLYPILQALDEEYLKVDAQLGGVDQRKIFMFSRENLPKIGYKKRAYFMNPLIPGLGKSGKMSSSEPNSKIDFNESDEVIKEKIMKAYSIDKVVEGNGLLAILKYILFRKLETSATYFEVKREEKWGGDKQYSNYEELESDFLNGDLSSVDLKPAVAAEIIKLISPIRDILNTNSELISKAYPTE